MFPRHADGEMTIRPLQAIREGLRRVDAYTSPRPETSGNLEQPSYFQAAFNGAVDGLYMFGPIGLVTGSAPAVLGIAVQKRAGQAAGIAVGTLSGAAVGAAVAATLGGPLGVAAGAVGGGLLGAFETFRGHTESESRDCANASMLSSLFLNGPVKMAAGLAGMAGGAAQRPLTKALIGAAVGAALGAGMAAAGLGTVSVATAAAVSGVTGAVGPFFGPRFSQFFRNLADDIGHGVTKVGHKLGLSEEGRLARAIGTVPASFVKEGLRGFLYSDGSLKGLLVGGVKESVRQVHIALSTRHGEEPALSRRPDPAPAP